MRSRGSAPGHNSPRPRSPEKKTPGGVFDRQLAQRKKSQFWKWFGALALLSVVGGGAAAVFTQPGREFVPFVANGVQTAIAVQQNPNLIFDNVGSDHVNILLIGEDRNWTVKQVLNPRTGKYAGLKVIDQNTPPRSDTLIIASLDRSSGRIRMISLPRDARVRFRDLEGERHRGKLNSVYASGGRDPQRRVAVLKKFLNDEMGLRIDRVAIIKLDAFDQIVDSVGGVYVDVDGALKRNRRTGKLYRGDINYEDNWGGWEVHLKPGKQWLNGERAHGYVRFRYDIEGDPGRIRRQQQVMQAVARRLMDLPKWQLPSRAQELKKQFNSDMSDEEMASAALFAKGMPSGAKIAPITTYGIYASNGDVILNEPENKKLFAAIFGDSFNPEGFLAGVKTTNSDSIGERNNENPAALEVLRAAGLVEAEEAGSGSATQ